MKLKHYFWIALLGLIPQLAAAQVSTQATLQTAIDNATGTLASPTVITVTANIALTSSITIRNSGSSVVRHVQIKGSNSNIKISRGSYFQDDIFIIPSGSSLQLTNITLDGYYSSSVRGSMVNNATGGTLKLLTGAVLKRNEKNGKGSGVYNAGTFTLSGGEISDIPGTGYGTGVYNAGTFTIDSGRIINNSNTGYPGVAVYNDTLCSFTMKGGTISENTGGDAIIFNKGTFTMTGGAITGNSYTALGYSERAGGVTNFGTFNLRGGSISGNKVPNNAYGNDITILEGGIFNLSGSPKVGTAADNKGIYLAKGTSAKIEAAGLQSGALLVFERPQNAIGGRVMVTNASASYLPYFKYASLDILSITQVGSEIRLIGFDLQASIDTATGTAANPTLITVPDGGVKAFNKIIIYVIDLNNVFVPRHIKLTGGSITRDTSFKNTMFDISEESSLQLTKITLDGNNVNTDYSIIYNRGSLSLLTGAILQNGINIQKLTGAGAIYNGPKGKLTMSGGEIKNNTTARGGGGVYNGGIFTLTGGTITGNTSSDYKMGNDVYNDKGQLNLSGNPKVGSVADKKGICLNGTTPASIETGKTLSSGALLVFENPTFSAPGFTLVSNIKAIDTQYVKYAGPATYSLQLWNTEYVLAVPQTIIWSQTLSATYGDAPIPLTAAVSKGHPIHYTSGNTGVATITDSILTAIGAGTSTIKAEQLGDKGYFPATAVTKSITVAKASPVITWNNPDDITYGTALSGAQLNAIAKSNGNSVLGTFTYTPATGTVLTAGNAQTLKVNFTPSYTNNYNTPAEKQVSITVLKKSVKVTPQNQGKTDGDADPVLTYNVSPALAAGDSFTGTLKREPGEEQGTYNITQNTLSLNSNYILTFIAGGKFTITAPAQNRLYVKATGGNNNNSGGSWGKALQNLDTALNRAARNTDIKEIWVAEGTYVPSQKAGDGTLDRDRAFVLPVNVKVYGGFTGSEIAVDQRPIRHSQLAEESKSILSGIIGNSNTDADSAYHVVIAVARNNDSITLDGFTITGGCANSHSQTNHSIWVNSEMISASYGGGAYAFASADADNATAAVNLTNNTFTDNQASYGGGAYADAYADADNATAAVNLTNNTFTDNQAFYGGGAYAFADAVNATAAVNLTNNTFNKNTATNNGGGAYVSADARVDNATAAVNLTNNTFNKNTATNNGGGAYVSADARVDNATAAVNLTNNTFNKNTATNNGGGAYVSAYADAYAGAKINITNTLFWGNRKTNTTTISSIYRANGPLNVSHCLLEESETAKPANINYEGTTNIFAQYPMFADTAAHNFTLLAGSPAINKGCNDSIKGLATDKNGAPRIYADTVDIGAYEYSLIPLISWNNPADITYGTPLSTAQLNASAAVNGVPVTGAFTYSPALDSILNAGAQTLTVSFTPDNSTYAITNKTVSITVLKKSVKVTPQNQGKTDGDADPVLTYNVSPALAAGDSFTGTLKREPGEEQGTYNITQNTLSLNSNYILTFIAGGKFTITAPAQNRLYVKATGGNNNNSGGSWGNALQNLDTALNRAAHNTDIKEIWVAEGTYVPSQKAGDGTLDRDRAFVLPVNVKVYGGFTGSEIAVDQRPIRHSQLAEESKSILSGIIGNSNTDADRAYHVVIAVARNNDSITLDGFTITGGCANSHSQTNHSIWVNSRMISASYGGGAYADARAANATAAVNLTNNTFNKNTATNKGGGAYVYAYADNATAAVNLTNNTFTDNQASDGGGAYADADARAANATAAVNLTNNTFNKNTATNNGGGAYVSAYADNATAAVNLTNNTFTDNQASDGGGAYAAAANATAAVNLTNNTFNKNTATNKGGGAYADAYAGARVGNATAAVNLTNNTFTDNQASDGGGAYADAYADAYAGAKINITNTLFWGNRKTNTTTISSIYRANGPLNVSHCLLEESETAKPANINYEGTTNIFAQYPMFADTAAHNFTLLAGSPAINKGCNDSIKGLATDKNGAPRIYADTVDIGAYEYSLIPLISWNNPADITYGTPLSTAQLNASVANNIQGTWEYSPKIGDILDAGTHTLSVTFTPTDVTNYIPAIKTVNITVKPTAILGSTTEVVYSGENVIGTTLSGGITYNITSEVTSGIVTGNTASATGVTAIPADILTGSGVVSYTITPVMNDYLGNAATYTVTVSEKQKYTVTLASNPADNNEIKVSFSNQPQGVTAFYEGEKVDIQMNFSDRKYTFKNWTDGEGMVISTERNFQYTVPAKAVTLTANFTHREYTITLEANPAEGGSVEFTGCSNPFDLEELVKATATPNSGYEFVNWTVKDFGILISNNALMEFSALDDLTFTANFKTPQQTTYTVNIIAEPAEAFEMLLGAGTHIAGSKIGLMAQAKRDEYKFVKWTNDLGEEFTENQIQDYILTGNRTFTAHAVPLAKYNLTVTATPSEGGTISGTMNGNNIPNLNGIHTEGTRIWLNAQTSFDYEFVNWTENGNEISPNSNFEYTITKDATLTANFKEIEKYTIVLQANPEEGGVVYFNGYNGPFMPGEHVEVSCNTNPGYEFVNWTVDGVEVSTTPYYQFPATKSMTIVANFKEKVMYTINLQTNPAEGGNINFIANSGPFIPGEPVEVRVNYENPAYLFINWTADNTEVSNEPYYQFSATKSMTLVANFMEIEVETTYTVTLDKNYPEAGIVLGGGKYIENHSVTLRAETNPGFMFKHWEVVSTGQELSTEPIYTFTLTQATAIKAVYAKLYTVTAAIAPENTGTISGTGTFAESTTVTLTAAPKAGYAFKNWTASGSQVSTAAAYSFLLTDNTHLIAHFVSTNATLKSLSVNQGSLHVPFSPSVTNYTVNVANSIDKITLTAEADHANATVNGTGEKTLEVGKNEFTITVTAEDGITKKTYTVNVIRQSLNPSNDATLKSITLSHGVLSPAFSPTTTSYTVDVVDTVTNHTIAAEANHALATVNGHGERTLQLGKNKVEITVTAEDGTQKVYTVTIIQTKLGINKVEQQALSVTIYPNPVKDVLHIKTEERIDNATIYNAGGQQCMHLNQLNGNTINVSSLPAGMYILKLKTSKGEVVNRFVKQ